MVLSINCFLLIFLSIAKFFFFHSLKNVLRLFAKRNDTKILTEQAQLTCSISFSYLSRTSLNLCFWSWESKPPDNILWETYARYTIQEISRSTHPLLHLKNSVWCPPQPKSLPLNIGCSILYFSGNFSLSCRPHCFCHRWQPILIFSEWLVEICTVPYRSGGCEKWGGAEMNIVLKC